MDDDIIPLSRFRAAVARPRGIKRVDALLSATDAAAAVAALSVPDLYFLIKDVGFNDCLELIELATAEQLRGCIDLDSWDRDHFELEATLPWLAIVMDIGFEKLTEVFGALDPELSPLILQGLCDVYDKNLQEAVPDDEERPMFTTPDTFFTVVLTAERDTEVSMTHRLIDFLYRGDADLARRALMAARSEPSAQLEEESYRWRSGRMADLGYVDFYQALEVFRPLDPEHAELAERHPTGEEPAREEAIHQLPTPIAEQVVGRAFLARTLSTIASREITDRIEAELLYLVNRVLAAARVSPGNEEAVRIGALHAASTLSLGLEYVSAGDPDRARDLLSRLPLIRLHRIGYTLTLRLSRTARVLAPIADRAGARNASILTALFAARPFFPTALDPAGTEGMRPFESRADLSLVARELSRLTLRLAASQSFGEAEANETDIDVPTRTALVRAVGGGDLLATPLSQDELTRFRSALERGRVPDGIRQRVANQVATRLVHRGAEEGREILPALLDGWFKDVESEIGAIPLHNIVDPRFITAVAIRK